METLLSSLTFILHQQRIISITLNYNL